MLEHISDEQLDDAKRQSIAAFRGRTDAEVYVAYALTLAAAKKQYPDLTPEQMLVVQVELFKATREAARQDARAELTVPGVQ